MSTDGMDSHEWLGKEEAAELLGVSTRQIERLTQDGLIEKKTLPRGPGDKTGRAVYSREAIEARKRGESTLLARVEAIRVDVARVDPFERIAECLVKLTAAVPEPKALPPATDAKEAKEAKKPPEPKPWLTLEESVSFSGLTRNWLLNAAESGSRGIRDMGRGARGGRWRFYRDWLRAGE